MGTYNIANIDISIQTRAEKTKQKNNLGFYEFSQLEDRVSFTIPFMSDRFKV